MKLKIYYLFLLISSSSWAQKLVLTGKVVDSKTNSPLPFATLSFDGGTRGAIGNANGEFKLIYFAQDLSDSIRVSYVGFETQVVPLNLDNSQHVIISLIEQKVQLNEVVVTTLTAKKILEMAMQRIDENYFDSPYLSKGFYRLTSRKNQKFVHLSEAVFDLYRSKSPKSHDLLRLEKMRALTDEREARGVELGIRPSGVFDMDKVNSKEFQKIFDKKRFLQEHEFVLEGVFEYDGVNAYLISFDQKSGVKNLGLRGNFYISKEDFAFLEMDFGITPESVSFFKFNLAYRTLMEIFGIDIKLLGQHSRVRYKKIEDKYYLKDVQENTDLQFKSERSHYNFILNTKVDYLVNDIKLEGIEPFEKQDILADAQLIEGQTSVYDSLFWKDYTIILPESDFSDISKVIIANNHANDTKEEISKRLKKYPKDTKSRIDSVLSFYHSKGLFNGNALIEWNGEVVLNKSYPMKGQSLGRSDRFRIGSTSKTFTSMLMLILFKEDKLDLSDPVSKYIDYYPHGDVTIDQLLSHQSGIPNYLSQHEKLVDIFRTGYSIDELIQKFCSDSLLFSPGEKFSYSNANYVLLAKIAEVVEKKPFNEILSEKLFDPLEMSNTYYGGKPDGRPVVKGYYYGKEEVAYPAQNVIGAGGIVSTTEDLLKWSRALDDGHLIDPVLMQTAVTPRADYTDWEAYYGYGWMIDRYLFKQSRKHKIIYHPGTDMAFYTMFLKQPDEQATLILLSNTGDFPRFEITEVLLQILN